MDERIPPHDALAEQSVLGALMLSQAAVWDVVGVVEARDFYDPKHGTIFGAVLSLVGRNEPVDAISVSDELAKAGDLSKIGGAPYLHELTGSVPTAANAGYYAGIVKDRAVRRRMLEAGTRIVNWGLSEEGDSAALVEKSRAELDRVVGGGQAEVMSIGSAFSDVIQELSSTPDVIETPWREINDVLVGLQGGRLYVVGARPGQGKTMVGAQLALAMCSRGPVAFSSLEMTRKELLQRLISSAGSVHMGSIERSSLSKDEWDRVAMVRPKIDQLPLFVDDRSDVTITQIKAFARSVSRRQPLGGVVVDYLQLVSGPQEKRYEIVSEVSRQLKIMAKELDCPVVALSQLNRDSAGTGKNKRYPTLADLRESGAIEQDADVVILLHRELERDDQPGNKLRMDVAKNRHGRQGYRHLLWEGSYARVSSWNRSGQYHLPIPE